MGGFWVQKRSRLTRIFRGAYLLPLEVPIFNILIVLGKEKKYTTIGPIKKLVYQTNIPVCLDFDNPTGYIRLPIFC
jgi:hypothetical protein